jgi:hypothetical protein
VQQGRQIRYEFSVRQGNFSPQRVSINGTPVTGLKHAANPYRAGGVRVSRAEFNAALKPSQNVVQIEI